MFRQLPAATVPLFVVFALIPFGASAGSAQTDHPYIGFLDCNGATGGCPVPPACGVGVVCIDAGHLSGSPIVYLEVQDEIIDPVAAYICWDPDGDGTCGGANGPGRVFCGSTILFTSVTVTLTTYIFLAGPTVQLDACGTPGVATSGVITHT